MRIFDSPKGTEQPTNAPTAFAPASGREIVRFRHPATEGKGARVRRYFMSLASSLAPGLLGDLAFKLFITPPRVSEKAQAALNRMQARLEAAEHFTLTVEGGEVQCYRFSGQGHGTVALIHGWAGQAAVMSAFIDPLTRLGYDVVLLDMPAHGRSAGHTLHMPLGVAALSALHARTGPWHGIIAHSFGCVVTVSALSGLVNGHKTVAADRIALISSPNSVPRLFDEFGDSLGLSAGAVRRLKRCAEQVTGAPIETFVAADILGRLGTPTLVLHAPDDKEVAFDNAESIASAGPAVILAAIPGAGHRRILYAKDVIRQISKFFE